MLLLAPSAGVCQIPMPEVRMHWTTAPGGPGPGGVCVGMDASSDGLEEGSISGTVSRSSENTAAAICALPDRCPFRGHAPEFHKEGAGPSVPHWWGRQPPGASRGRDHEVRRPEVEVCKASCSGRP